jgi:PAS domain S-box-containing protein
MSALRLLLILEENQLSSKAADLLRQRGDLAVEIVSANEALGGIDAGEYDAVICGMNLRDVREGFKILTSIREQDPLLPFFFYSPEDSPQLISRAFKEGANDYFVANDRPQQIDRIAEAVKVNIDLARLLRAQQADRARSPFEEKYAGLFEELEEGSLMVNADNGLITFVNDSLAGTLGFDAHEMIGRPLEEYLGKSFGAEQPPTAGELIDRLSGGDMVAEIGLRLKAGGNRHFWSQVRLLELGGSKVMLWQCRDVTRFEQLEREVIAVRNQLRTIVENSADAIIVAREDGTIEFFGGAAPQLFGVSPEEVTGQRMEDLFDAHSRNLVRMLDKIGDRKRVSGLESSIISRWGTRIPVSVAITVLPSSDGVTRHLFNVLDITAQKVGEAEKMLSAELIRIVSTGAGPVEALPKLISRVRDTVPIDYGLVVAIDPERDSLGVVALYTAGGAGQGVLRVGQTIGIENQPAEEELWLREGIIRNDLKDEGLSPLERLLFEQGVRSYVSVPLQAGEKLIGGAHFGSLRPFALNRGHLILFKDIAGALAGALVRARSSGEAQRYRLFTSALAESFSDPTIICDQEGMILEGNKTAREFLGADAEMRGRPIGPVMRAFSSSFVTDIAWLRNNAGTQRPCTDRTGRRWMVAVMEVGGRKEAAGYIIRLQKS